MQCCDVQIALKCPIMYLCFTIDINHICVDVFGRLQYTIYNIITLRLNILYNFNGKSFDFSLEFNVKLWNFRFFSQKL